MKPYRPLLCTLLVVFLAGTGSAQATDPTSQITLPEGFQITVYRDSIADARSLALSPSGTLFVGTRGAGKVYAVQDLDGDQRAETMQVIATGLNLPNGVAFRDGSLYVAEVNRLLRYDAIEEHLDTPPQPKIIYDDLPRTRLHGWKYIGFGPDNLLYVTVGAPCDSCDPGDPFAAILRMRPDGSGREVFARGIRNSVGFDWQPDTGRMWFTDNGRDWLGDNLPPDELNVALRRSQHFGFPYLHGKEVVDPEFGDRGRDIVKTPPVIEFQAHVAPLGVQFYTGTSFPERYRGQLFVAQHGSWNRSSKVGYRIMAVFVKGDQAVGKEAFADGWLNNGKVSGRPVDLEMLPDGSLLVSDDMAGKIYRISYRNHH